MISVIGLTKRFGDVQALSGIDLEVAAGEVVGVLGPNGAGKTTLISCLATLLVPDEGRATVAGHDVVAQPEDVRRALALTGQFSAVDHHLTVRENLVLFARLLRMGKAAATHRTAELLTQFDLDDSADRRAGALSGGLRRRLDLAASMVGDPRVLFLDEPTTGLDPRSRQTLWEKVRRLRDEGMTIVLTTQYLDEADALAGRIVVIDRGRVIAEGTASELKSKVGGAVCEVVVNEADRQVAAVALAALGEVTEGQGRLRLPAEGTITLTAVVRALDACGVTADDLALRRPTLDDVFLTLTGHGAERPDLVTDEEVAG